VTSEDLTQDRNRVSDTNFIPFVQAYSRAPMGPRLGLIDVFNGKPLDDRAISILGSNLTNTNCTREDLTSWLESIHGAWPEHTDLGSLFSLVLLVSQQKLLLRRGYCVILSLSTLTIFFTAYLRI
jgi:hypothetical protein